MSQEPVADLLRRGHKHPVIQDFTYRFLRLRSDHLKNIKEQLSQMHLKRLGYMDEATIARDEASIYQADARIGGALPSWKQSHGYIQDRLGQASSYLEGAKDAHERASDELFELQGLQASIHRQQEVLRNIDKGFVGIMLRKYDPVKGDEWLAEFIYKIFVYQIYSFWPRQMGFKNFWLLLEYGNPKVPRSIPEYVAYKYCPKELDKACIENKKKFMIKYNQEK